MPNDDLPRKPGQVRRLVSGGGEIELTFHRKPYALIVPHEVIEAERAELERLRAEVEEYRRRESAA